MQRVEAFEVLEPGILTTIQDLGRYGFSQFGVPPSLPKVAQLKPGNRVRFSPISIEEAHRHLKGQEERLRSFKELFEQR
jgi:antagonist of KipI